MGERQESSSSDTLKGARPSLRSSKEDSLALIDSHCHLHDKEFFTEDEAEERIKRAHEAGVQKIVCIGTDPQDSLAARDFAANHDGVYWTYGVHPENALEVGVAETSFSRNNYRLASPEMYIPDGPDRFARKGGSAGGPAYDIEGETVRSEKRCSDRTPAPVAIGEVGLDYHYEGYDREAQIRLFEQMLQLATDNDLPVSFHVREAFADFFPVVENFPKVRGVVHSFTDSKKVLRRILNETEFYIGVNGLATYSTLPTPPLERTLLETDAPFLAPVPYRGGRNEPAYIADIAKWLAAKLGISLTEVAKITTNNVTKLFRLN